MLKTKKNLKIYLVLIDKFGSDIQMVLFKGCTTVLLTDLIKKHPTKKKKEKRQHTFNCHKTTGDRETVMSSPTNIFEGLELPSG